MPYYVSAQVKEQIGYAETRKKIFLGIKQAFLACDSLVHQFITTDSYITTPLLLSWYSD